MGPTVQLCCRDVLDPSPHSYSARPHLPEAARDLDGGPALRIGLWGRGGEKIHHTAYLPIHNPLLLYFLFKFDP